MNEIRSYASLSGSLLARKGGAKPAMRPQPLAAAPMLDDLGWDDMGDPHEAPVEHVPSSIAALTPAPKPTAREETPVHVQQRVLSDHFGADEPEEAPAAAPKTPVRSLAAPARKHRQPARDIPAGRKAAFTLRLDADRHLKLRLASAVTGRSSQQLVTSALDAFLETLPEIGTLAQRLPARAGTGN